MKDGSCRKTTQPFLVIHYEGRPSNPASARPCNGTAPPRPAHPPAGVKDGRRVMVLRGQQAKILGALDRLAAG
jgi:hypothetical protein